MCLFVAVQPAAGEDGESPPLPFLAWQVESIVTRECASGAYWEERLLEEVNFNFVHPAYFQEGSVVGAETPAVPLADAQLVGPTLTDGVGELG